MTFQCFRDGKCEWRKGLCDFTEQFNGKFNKKYRLSKCLDIPGNNNENKPQPEVLLEANNEPSIVIECKKIVCPGNYFENHRKWHTFYDDFSRCFQKRLKGVLPDARYVLTIS